MHPPCCWVCAHTRPASRQKYMIEKRLSYETKKETLPKPKRMEVASKEDYFELLRPVFPKEAIQDLSEDELEALLDHVN
jgi:hypothetical protein